MKFKIVRILLRVSSEQQLEKDGDLGIQRKIVQKYIEQHSDWKLDSKEYFEGSNSGYKNSVADRDILQEALKDAQNGEYDILVVYKDDRLGRRVLEIPTYILQLKNAGVDIYSVTDGLLSPQSTDDINGIIMLTMRYGMAQKSSSDTGMRVKDTAQQLVRQGRFMGGIAPYGYRLEYSGEFSKHQRALKHLVIMPERAEVVKYIYDLSYYKEFGSSKIAHILNTNERYSSLAPKDVWKSGTITSILTNPIYAGYTSYKRRERVNGKYRCLDSKEWILSEKPNDDITIIDENFWQKVQEKRRSRGEKYKKSLKNENAVTITRNEGELALIDVAYCGYCGCKLTNGTKYDYWTIKSTGERRSSRKALYKCQNIWQGVPHPKMKQILANKIEPIVFESLIDYIEKLQENENIFEQIAENQNVEIKKHKKILTKEKNTLNNIQKNIEITEDAIPLAIAGNYPLSVEELADSIKKQKEKRQQQMESIKRLENELNNMNVSINEWETLQSQIPTWRDVFLKADTATKRVLVDKLIERIEITDEQVNIRFKINLNNFLPEPRMTNNGMVPEQRLRFHHHFFHCL